MVLTLERSIEAIFLRTQISFKAKCSDHQDRYSSLVVYHPEKMISRKSDGHIVQWMSNQTLCYVGIMSVLHFHYVFSTISTYRMTSVVLFLAEERIFLFTGASWLALGLIWFPVDSAMGKECLNLTIILMQSRGKYFLQLHFHSLIHCHGFVSKVAQLQLSKSLLRQRYRK